MRTLTHYSVLLSALLSMTGLLITPGQALAERHSSSQWEDLRDHRTDRPHADRNRTDRPRIDRPRTDRPRTNRPHTDRHRYDRRYGDYRRRFIPPYSPWRYTPRYRYYDKPRYSYPHRYYYPGHRHYYLGDDFLGWLAFTAITLVIIDNLNEQQQREHEHTLHEALQAPVGETIHWEDNNASGSVTVIREGTSSEGRYCREYTQGIEIGGESQQAYGTACRNPDGSWEIVD